MSMSNYKVSKGKYTFIVSHQANEYFQCAEICLGGHYLGSVPYGPNFEKELNDFITELSQRTYEFD